MRAYKKVDRARNGPNRPIIGSRGPGRQDSRANRETRVSTATRPVHETALGWGLTIHCCDIRATIHVPGERVESIRPVRAAQLPVVVPSAILSRPNNLVRETAPLVRHSGDTASTLEPSPVGETDL